MTDTTAPAASALFEHVATRDEAIAHFRGRLAVEVDVSDVAAALAEPEPGFVLVDTRSDEAWAQGHVPGALHLPRRHFGGPRRFGGDGGEVGHERLDLLFDLMGNLIDAAGQAHAGHQGAHLDERHGQDRDCDDPQEQLAHASSPRSLACWNASRPRSMAVATPSRFR